MSQLLDALKLAGWVLIGLLALYAWEQHWALKGVRKDLAAAQQENATLRGRIELQNQAVDALQAASDARVRNAQNGLAGALQAANAARSEAERLKAAARASASQKPSTQAGISCPPSMADQAAATIREGLR